MATTPLSRTSLPNRRRRVRHKVQTPAYASFTAESKGAMLDLHEIVDLSEDGVAVQCSAALELNRRFDLCLDLAEATGSIYTTGQVIWSNDSGRTGFRFSGLAPDSLFHLREWLFLNAMAGVANAEAEGMDAPALRAEEPPLRPDYTDTLAAVTVVQRQVESLGSDLLAVLPLIASRAETLVRASGAAIALATENPEIMVCRASAGADAPPVGAPLQVGSGFSGACVREARTLRCDDTETDARVDRESCRALGIRSILATPVRMGEKVAGILEVFSREPRAFNENDNLTLQRLAETVLAAVNRAARTESVTSSAEPAPFQASPGSVLFAAVEEGGEAKPPAETSGESAPEGWEIRLPRSYLVLLIMAAITIVFALGYELAAAIQAKLESSRQGTVLAASPTPAAQSSSPQPPSVITANLEQLHQMAENGDSAAQNALGLRYATGEGVKQDESEAVRWFTKAAEQGNVGAQSKLGALYWRGREIPQNVNQAYFWMVLARAGGDDASTAQIPFVRNRMTREQTRAIEQQADNWLQQRQSPVKPEAGH